MPSFFASSGDFRLTALPSIEISPRRDLSAPKSPSASSLFPEPIIPVIPSISPFLREKLIGANIFSVLNSLTSRSMSSDGVPSRTGNSSFSVLPSIDLTRVFRSTESMSNVPAFWPSLNTVALSQTRKTSSRWWDM